MKAIIVSDLHIGSKFFVCQDFAYFLNNIPEDAEFILNGDIIENPCTKLRPTDQKILNCFEQMSYRQKVVWVRGNHDNGYIPQSLGQIQIKQYHSIQKRVFITHGDFFDKIMPQSRAFIKTFRMMHDLRVKLGARPVHVAEYAKKWKRFYGYLRKNVMLNAVNYAAENGFEAVACGHTHYAEEQFINGIRYFNTGAWTELPTYYVRVTDSEMTLNKTTDSAGLLKSPAADTVPGSSPHHQNSTQPVSHHN
ncbi:MAG: metallophosphoesterase family protein [Desulfobacterales bacterium]|jgi:UDP-2,3-diacylglucosamine pyrophosphatase LpxH